jgi:hypothetical protein
MQPTQSCCYHGRWDKDEPTSNASLGQIRGRERGIKDMELLPKRATRCLASLVGGCKSGSRVYPLNMEEDNHKIAFDLNVDGVTNIQTIASNWQLP